MHGRGVTVLFRLTTAAVPRLSIKAKAIARDRSLKLRKCSQEAVLDIMKTYKTPIVASTNAYELLIEALQQITTKEFEQLSPKSKAKVKEMLVIVGGDINSQVSRVCWYLDSSNQIVELCKIPYDDLACNHSVCATPLGFSITGGANSDLCIIYNTVAKSWSRLQNFEQRGIITHPSASLVFCLCLVEEYLLPKVSLCIV